MYDIPIETIAGVGEKTQSLFAKGGIRTIWDLLHYLPKGYLDLRRATPFNKLVVGEQHLIIAKIRQITKHQQAHKTRLEVSVENNGSLLFFVFFHEALAYQFNNLGPGSLITAVGTVSSFGYRTQMVHPIVYEGDRTHELSGIWPVYSELQGLTSKEIRRFMVRSLQEVEAIPINDSLPTDFCQQFNLSHSHNIFPHIHMPERNLDDENLFLLNTHNSPAHRRLAFNELHTFQLAVQKKRSLHRTKTAFTLVKKDPKRLFKKHLPFKATKAQQRALEEIFSDLSHPIPMHRLLQGDVGAGKTAVALITAIHCAQAGMQSAIMAPTEILAQQHFENFRQSCEPFDIKVGFLTGNTTKKERTKILKELAAGEISILIGTHALISDDVSYKNLAFCVIDEQHRFGVLQRNALKEKGHYGSHVPHLLAMTATPIPRSLAHTLYGDLDLSVLDELPPGRTPVKTTVHKGACLEVACEILRDIMAKNEKSYVIFPLIEESEKIDLADAIKGFNTIASQFGIDSVGIVHGRLDAATKNSMMDEFAAGIKRILVATSVVEVGVDVKDAAHILILNAERFGLSQLHQLRGRVGRGTIKGFCYLITNGAKTDQLENARLSILTKTNDGFKIANEDLKLRGAGEFLGTKQSGFNTFRFCDLSKHADLIAPARELANNEI